MSKKKLGSSIDDFMKEEGIFEEAQAQGRSASAGKKRKRRLSRKLLPGNWLKP